MVWILIFKYQTDDFVYIDSRFFIEQWMFL